MNEIVTFGQGYKLTNGIKVFVKSAKAFCNKLTILYSKLDVELVKFLNKHEINLIDVESLNKKHNVDSSLSPYTLKVIYFYLYAKNYSTSKNLYMCDFTDVFIQNNIFDCIASPELTYVSSENKLIGNCQTNTTWISLCYNSDVFSLLKAKEILNGGSILGNKSAVISTLKEMCADMSQIISRVGNYPNIDQASLNKVVYFDKARFTILRNMEIANLAHLSNESWIQYENGLIGIKGVIPYVIHQHDVIKSLETFLYEKFN